MRRGLKIKIKRLEKGITAKDLAKKLGVTHQTISLYETEKIYPRPNIMKQIATILDSTVEELFFSE